MLDAVVVGSGPNGLAAAATIASAGRSVLVIEAADEVGGGTRSHLAAEWGTLHDDCSAVHPLGVSSPLMRSLPLHRHGLEWLNGEVGVAHPLSDGRAGVILDDLDDTIAAMSVDGGARSDAEAWRGAFGWMAGRFDDLAADLMGPILHLPRHPLSLARFAPGALGSVQRFARRFATEGVRALYAGAAAHAMRPLDSPASAAPGLILVAAGHRGGWPVARGGSQSIADALAGVVAESGGEIRTGENVTDLRDLPPSRVVLLDVAPRAALGIVGEAQVPGRVARGFRRWKHGPAAHKVDLVVRGPIPWADEHSPRALTVHCGGTFEEIAAAERAVHHGRMPERPFVLVAQQYLVDPSRSNGDHHPVWAYAHVPRGYTGDATEALLGQIERFAPGFRDVVVSADERGPADLEQHNPNYIGGDIATGANSAQQLVFRPRPALDPYRITPNVFLCSAATPPGAGVHGMCGWYAARSALRVLDQRSCQVLPD